MNAWLLGYGVVAAIFALGWFVYCLRTSPAPPLAAAAVSALSGAFWPVALVLLAAEYLADRRGAK